MKTTDKLLTGIVVGVVLLVVVAFGVALLRPKPAYQLDDTPEGVTHNYLLALKQEDYARAYGYLSPDLRGYPTTYEDFLADIGDYTGRFGWNTSSSLTIVSTRLSGEVVLVTVRERTFSNGGLLNSSSYSTEFIVTVKRAAASGDWRLINADAYWAECWTKNGGCQSLPALKP